MKFTGFASGCFGKVLLIILCIVVGMALSLGGIALGGYIVLTRQGMMGKIEDTIGSDGFKFEEEVREMSVMEWGMELMAAIANLSDNTIGSLEGLLGMSIISDTIEDAMGVSADIIRSSTISELGKTVSNNLSINIAKEKFGINFPDMPIFSDPAFLAKPLSTAFGDFNSYTLDQVIEITDDSNAVLRELRKVSIADLGGSATNEVINSMFLCELMTITDESSMTLRALKYASITSTYEYDVNGEILTDDDGNPVYKMKTFTETVNGTKVEREMPLKGINDCINSLYIKDVVEITETSNVILRKMRTPTEEEIADGKAELFGTEDLLVTELGGGRVNEIVDSTEIGELITIHEEDDPDGNYTKSEPIMIALKYTAIGDLNNKMKELRLNEIFAEEKLADGALSLIDPETTLPNIPSAMTAAMTGANVAALEGKGIIAKESFQNVGNMKPEQKAFIYNSSLSDLIKGVIDFIANPVDGGTGAVNYSLITPKTTVLSSTTFASITDFVNSYNQYDIVDFGNNRITVNIDSEQDAIFYSEEKGAYLIPLFSAKNWIGINFGGETAYFAVYDVTVGEDMSKTYTLSRNQYGYAFYIDGPDSTPLPTAAFDGITVERS